MQHSTTSYTSAFRLPPRELSDRRNRGSREGVLCLGGTLAEDHAFSSSKILAPIDIPFPPFLRRHVCLSAVLILPAVVQSQHPADSLRTITLPEALEMAARVSPALAAGQATVTAARTGRLMVTGEYLPSLGVASSAGRGTTVQGANGVTNGVPVPSTLRPLDDLYGSGISAAVPLFTGGRRRAERHSADAQQTAADASLNATQYDVRLATKQVYFDVLRAGELMDVATAQVAEAEAALRDAGSRLGAGTTTRSDVLRARVALATARDALATAGSEQTASRFSLARAIGSDMPVDAAPVPDDQSVPLPVSRDSLVLQALSAAPVARAAAANAQSADAAISAARAQYFPTILASGGYGWLEQRSVNPRPVGGWTLQMGVSYPLFNGFQREAAVTRAEADAVAAHSAAVDTERGVRADAVRSYDDATVAAQRIGFAREAVAAAREDLRVQEARYRAGASTFLDEVTSQFNLAQAETSLVQARYDYQIARATLERVLGRELE
ncbi:MAG TPA: TolC family protein [Gemmatimonadaceae bacterium]